MKELLKLFGVGALVLFGGCTSLKIDSGKIVGKVYEPPREYTTLFSHSETVNGTRVEKSYQQRWFDDGDYIVVIGRKNGGGYDTRGVFVSREIYESLEVGREINLSEIDYRDRDCTNYIIDEVRVN
jgi:hypothetical protein